MPLQTGAITCVRAVQAADDTTPRLQLWQRHNWHWYLKWEHLWPHATRVHVAWSEAEASTLHTVTGGGAFDTFSLSAAGCISPLATAAVIDGRDLLVTPLLHCMVPPPMAAARVRCCDAVAAVAWGAVESCEVLAAVTATGVLHLATSVEGSLWEETAEEACAACGSEPGCVQDVTDPMSVRAGPPAGS